MMNNLPEKIFGKSQKEIDTEREILAKRNIVDYYKYWLTEDIVKDLDRKRNNFSILCSNIQYDFNLGSVIRNANAFLAKEVLLYGRKKIDTRACVGTHHYTHFKHVKDIEDLAEIAKDKNNVFIGFDDLHNAKPLESFSWPKDKHVIMCFGQEATGLTKEIISQCQDIVYIKQYGSVRSLNVGVASGIGMFSYCQQVVRGQ